MTGLVKLNLFAAEQSYFQDLLELKQRDQLRSLDLVNIDSDQVSHRPVSLCSNDYLGLSEQDNDLEATAGGSKPRGSTGSRLLSGNSSFALKLERKIANFHAGGAALTFCSGYLANVAVLSTLPSRHDTILYDEQSHASLKDGVRLSNARSFAFRHNDLDDLSKKAKLARGQIFVVVESLYSMDGDFAPLFELARLAREIGALLIIDEAHAGGIYGPNGSGIASALSFADVTIARIYTFGKAFGAAGAAVVSSCVVRDYLVNYARPFIYTTAPSPQFLTSIDAAYEAVELADVPRMQLTQRILTAKRVLSELLVQVQADYGAAASDWRYLATNTPIQPLIIPGNRAVRSVALQMRSQGFDVRAVLSPTVKAGRERLRICLRSSLTDSDILRFAESLLSSFSTRVGRS